MSASTNDAAGSPLVVGALADSCRWLADAHDANDLQQVVAALCELYRLLAASGWGPPPRAATLLELHEATVDAGLTHLLDLAPRTGWGRTSA